MHINSADFANETDRKQGEHQHTYLSMFFSLYHKELKIEKD